MKITQDITTRYRRTTSQGVENAKLDYSPDIQLKQLAFPLSETVIARYPLLIS